ncbi:MAG: phosphoribosylformylglycinamidine synthase subunit PurS [Clostridiales bacterium]|nr:phosphoribosylformylglycinamidine synthase subunit PurS [Clostridiales bacterium]
MKVRILVSFKESVLDPQGQTVKNALHTLGYDFIKDVRQGKVFEVELQGLSEDQAQKVIPEIADKVLANPIIEKFSWEVLSEGKKVSRN